MGRSLAALAHPAAADDDDVQLSMDNIWIILVMIVINTCSVQLSEFQVPCSHILYTGPPSNEWCVWGVFHFRPNTACVWQHALPFDCDSTAVHLLPPLGWNTAHRTGFQMENDEEVQWFSMFSTASPNPLTEILHSSGSPMLLLEAVHVRTADFFARNATLYSTKFSCNGRETLLAEVFRWLMTSDLITRKWSQTNRQALPQCNLTTFSNVNRFSGAKTCEDNLYTTRIDSYIELSVAVSAWFGPACPPVFVGHSWRCSHFFWPRHNRCGHPDVGSTPKWWHPNRFL